MIRGDDEARFWSKTERRGKCIIWIAGVDKDGYGKFTTGGHASPGGQRHIRAHRWIFERIVHVLKPGELLRHRCDTPACVNVSHMIAGSQLDNVHDALARGRRRQVLDPQMVRRLRAARKRGDSIMSLARIMGINYSSAINASKGRTWRHIT